MTVVTLLGINEIYCVGGMGRGKELGVYFSKKVVILMGNFEIDRTNDKRGKGETSADFYHESSSMEVYVHLGGF